LLKTAIPICSRGVDDDIDNKKEQRLSSLTVEDSSKYHKYCIKSVELEDCDDKFESQQPGGDIEI